MDSVPEYLPTQLRDRRNQLAELSPEDRLMRLAADLRADLIALDSSERIRFIDSLTAHFPVSYGGENAESAPKAVTVAKASTPLTTAELVTQLKERLRNLDAASRGSVLDDLSSTFPRQPKPGIPADGGFYTWVDLGAALESVAQKTRNQAGDRDLLLNEKIAGGRPTAESEFAADLLRRLADKIPTDHKFETRRLAQLAAVLMVELGCLEGLAKNIVLQLDKNAFDQIHGQLVPNPQDRPREFLAEFLKTGDQVELARRIRNFNGLVKGLLWWYRFALSQGVSALTGLSPMDFDRFFRRSPHPGWDSYKKKYSDVLLGMAELSENAGGDEIERSLYRVMIKKVSATLADYYQWGAPEGY